MPYSEVGPQNSDLDTDIKDLPETPDAPKAGDQPVEVPTEEKISPEVLNQYRELAEKVVESNKRTIFARFGFGANLHVKFGTTFSLDAKSGTICLDVKQFAEKQYNKDQIAWSVMMQLSKLSERYSHPEDMKQRALYEKASGKKRSLNLFMKTMDTVYHKHMVARKIPVFQDNFKGGKEVASLYNEKLLPTDDLTKLPKHLQYLNSILLSEFKRTAVVDPEVQNLLEEKISLDGKTFTAREIVARYLKPYGGGLEPADRFKVLTETLEQQYLQLLTDDLDEESKGNGRIEELDSDLPPEEQDEYTPQSMETKEANGKSPYIFQLNPGVNGYFKGGVRSVFDKNSLKWRKQKQLSGYDENIEEADFNYKGKLRTGQVSIPLPQDAAIDMSSFQSTSPVNIVRDQHGAFYAESSANQEFNFNFGKQEFYEPDNSHEFTEQLFTGSLTSKTEAVLEEVETYMSMEEKADKLIDYIRDKYTYHVQAQGELFNSATSPDDYFKKIDQALQLECYTSNTFFVGLCRKVDVPARLITGHYVQGKNKDGSSDINSNTGHAWSEIWNGTAWIRKDATPPAAPEDFDDDYDDAEENNPDQGSDEEMEDFVDEQKEEQEKKEKEQKEKAEKEWCEERDITTTDLERFREIEKRVEGHLEGLTQLWQSIIYGRNTGVNVGLEGHFKTGENLDIQKTIRDWPQVVNRDFENLRLMERMTSKESEVKRPELIRVRLLVDTSGSMNKPEKVKILQESTVLLLSSLNKFDRMLAFNKFTIKSELKVDTQVIGFDSRAYMIKDFKSNTNEVIDEGKMIKTISHLRAPRGSSTNDDLALEMVTKSLSPYEEKSINDGKTMEIVFVITDGGSDDAWSSRDQLEKLLGKNVIVRAFQIGDVQSGEKKSFRQVWNNDRESPLGFEVGTKLEKLPEYLAASLKEYLGGIDI